MSIVGSWISEELAHLRLQSFKQKFSAKLNCFLSHSLGFCSHCVIPAAPFHSKNTKIKIPLRNLVNKRVQTRFISDALHCRDFFCSEHAFLKASFSVFTCGLRAEFFSPSATDISKLAQFHRFLAITHHLSRIFSSLKRTKKKYEKRISHNFRVWCWERKFSFFVVGVSATHYRSCSLKFHRTTNW